MSQTPAPAPSATPPGAPPLSLLVVGAGSIGARHLRNLRALGETDLRVVDVDPARAQALAAETGALAAPSLEAALAAPCAGVRVALLCTPNHLHVEHALACARAGYHLFIEKPLAISLDGTDALRAALEAGGLRAMVGCNLRYDDVYAEVTRLLDAGALGKIHAARLHFGYDLARWRPGVDYRQIYSAWRAQGGGIALDCIHELDLAARWFGLPDRLVSIPRRTGALDGDVEDVLDLAVQWKSGLVANLHLNYRDPVYNRGAVVAGDRAMVEADFVSRTVTLKRADGTVDRKTFPDDLNAMYVRELSHFLGVLRRTRPSGPDLEDGIAAVRLALAARDHAPAYTFPRPRPLEKVAVIVQARLGSKRLPGKVLKTAVGRPLLELLVERLGRGQRVAQVILATSEAPADRALVDEAERLGIPWYVGSEDDVLARYLGAMRRFGLPAAVRITADCPLMDPAVVDAVIERFCAIGPDYMSNIHPTRQYPDGFDVEVVTREALERADRECHDLKIREHVTLHLVQHPERYQHAVLTHPEAEKMAPIRVTLDTELDYRLLRALFEKLHPDNPGFGLDDVVRLLDHDPEIRAMHAAAAAPGAAAHPGA